jgi:enoyl-CoA hydratase
MSDVMVEQDGPVAIVILNRPRAMNALSSALRRELAATLSRLDAAPETRAIILTGAGERAFSAGLDLKELGSEPGALAAGSARSADMNPVKAIELCRKPIIAAINGFAITGGFELALACDVLIASTNARFADTHARVGVMPGWGLSQKLPRLIGPYRAKELSLTGRFLDAAEAANWGLINRVVAPAELMPTAIAMAREMAQVEPDMLANMKTLIDDGYALSLREALALEHTNAERHNSALAPGDIEARRGAVRARGRRFAEDGV